MSERELSLAVLDVLSERTRQIISEGWTPQHDDGHEDGSLAAAAACYANPTQLAIDGHEVVVEPLDGQSLPLGWPKSWDRGWFKPTTPRRDLVKAGALIIAEIERLDREAAKGGAA